MRSPFFFGIRAKNHFFLKKIKVDVTSSMMANNMLFASLVFYHKKCGWKIGMRFFGPKILFFNFHLKTPDKHSYHVNKSISQLKTLQNMSKNTKSNREKNSLSTLIYFCHAK
jgi:uncharacterized protein (DUF486 family)